MGWLSKFISLRSIPFYLGGACAAPKLRWASPQDLWLWNFDNHPIFKIAILRREKIFSPERRSKVVKFAKNDRLEALILLARDEPFLFFPCKWSKGGTIGWVFLIFSLDESLQFCPFLKLFLTSFPLTSIIEALEIVVFVYRHILAPFMYFISQFNIQEQLPSLLNV